MLITVREAIDAMADEERKANYADWFLTQSARAGLTGGRDVEEAKANLWAATNRRARLEACVCRGKAEGSLILRDRGVYRVNSGRILYLGVAGPAAEMFALVDDDDVRDDESADRPAGDAHDPGPGPTTSADRGPEDWVDIACEALERAIARPEVPGDAATGPEFDIPRRRRPSPRPEDDGVTLGPVS